MGYGHPSSSWDESLIEPLSATESTNVGAGEQRPSDTPKPPMPPKMSPNYCNIQEMPEFQRLLSSSDRH